jgi:hypothetical protein
MVLLYSLDKSTKENNILQKLMERGGWAAIPTLIEGKSEN